MNDINPDWLSLSITDSPAQPPLPPHITANGPALWREILNRMPAGAIIAGGAVRDFFLGVEPKDIDVFVDQRDLAIPPGFDSLGDDRREEYAAVNNIAVVVRGHIGSFQVDLIGIDGFRSGDRLMDDFDFGITRSWFDGEIHDTEEARADREAQVVTLLLTDRPGRARIRFERFNERMGGGWMLLEAANG